MRSLEKLLGDRYGCGEPPPIEDVKADVDRLSQSVCCKKGCGSHFCVAIKFERLREYLEQRLAEEKPSTRGRMDLLERFLNEAGFDFEVIAQLESEEVHPVFFEVIKAKLK